MHLKIALILTISTVFETFSEDTNLIIELNSLGKIKGSTATSTWSGRQFYQFRGIKLAEPPVGERRFKAPIKIKPWAGVMDVTNPAKACADYNVIKNQPIEELVDIEDCINLSVYSSDLTGSKPVLFYIHGGGFYFGASKEYSPDNFMEKDIVLVVPEYRLGPLGFLTTMTGNIPGNSGFMDVVLALEWVQHHISKFGGDPKRVTIAGQSVGSTTVASLIYSPVVPDYFFQQAILQSGGSSSPFAWDTNPIENTFKIAKKAGCDVSKGFEYVEQCFFEMDVLTMCKAFWEHKIEYGLIGLNKIGGTRLIKEGSSDVFPAAPYEMLREAGGKKNITMMAGFVKHDGSFYLPILWDAYEQRGLLDTEMGIFDILDNMNNLVGVNDKTGSLVATQIPFFDLEDKEKVKFMDIVEEIHDLTAIALIKGPVLKEAQTNVKKGATTFVYTFDYEGEHTISRHENVERYPFKGGVHHSNDNIYMYSYLQRHVKLNKNDTKMAKLMIDLWSSFVIDGVPKADGVPKWPEMSKFNGPYMHLNEKCTIGENLFDEFKIATNEKKYLNKTMHKLGY